MTQMSCRVVMQKYVLAFLIVVEFDCVSVIYLNAAALLHLRQFSYSFAFLKLQRTPILLECGNRYGCLAVPKWPSCCYNQVSQESQRYGLRLIVAETAIRNRTMLNVHSGWIWSSDCLLTLSSSWGGRWKTRDALREARQRAGQRKGKRAREGAGEREGKREEWCKGQRPKEDEERRHSAVQQEQKR